MNVFADDDEFLPATPRGPSPGWFWFLVCFLATLAIGCAALAVLRG